jgi:DNA-binding MurR/RpiR family transcriptional regulator
MREGDRVNNRLREAYPGLSPRLQKAARFVLDAPDEVAFNSLRQLAGKADVHPSTLVRLAKHLGYPGYSEFRAGFQSRLRERPASLSARAHRLRDRGREPGTLLFEELLASAGDNVRQSFAATTPEVLAEVADRLAGARDIYVVGMRKCYPVAYFIHYSCRMFRHGMHLVTGTAGTLADELRDISADDAMIAIGFDPYTRETVRAAEDAAARGAMVVAITDSVVSPLSAAARHTFVVANGGPTFFRSIAAAMALGEAIVAFLLSRGGDRSLEILRDMEGQLDRFEAYWEDGSSRRVRA